MYITAIFHIYQCLKKKINLHVHATKNEKKFMVIIKAKKKIHDHCRVLKKKNNNMLLFYKFKLILISSIIDIQLDYLYY